MWNDIKIPLILGAALGCYLLGSVNLTLIVGKLLSKKDIRKTGSGNAGATNLLREFGWKVALPVLISDVAKGSAAMFLCGAIGLESLAPPMMIPYLLGNVYPVFHGFRGGKGVAAVTGTTLAISPLVMLLGGIVFLIGVVIFRWVSVGSLLMVISYGFLWEFTENGIPTTAAFATVAIIIVFTHRENIRRLIRGQEPKIGRPSEKNSKERTQ